MTSVDQTYESQESVGRLLPRRSYQQQRLAKSSNGEIVCRKLDTYISKDKIYISLPDARPGTCNTSVENTQREEENMQQLIPQYLPLYPSHWSLEYVGNEAPKMCASTRLHIRIKTFSIANFKKASTPSSYSLLLHFAFIQFRSITTFVIND